MLKYIRAIYNKIMINERKRGFEQGALTGKNLMLRPSSLCSNGSGNRELIRIGNNCLVMGRLISRCGGRIIIGDNCYIGGDSLVGASDLISIGNYAMIAANVRIYDNNNHPTDPQRRLQMSESGDYAGELWSWKYASSEPVIIDDNVWIGECSTILKGVHIGKGAVIGCCAVVTKDVPAYAMVVGNPGRIVKYLKDEK